jgi:hypothetical protein
MTEEERLSALLDREVDALTPAFKACNSWFALIGVTLEGKVQMISSVPRGFQSHLLRELADQLDAGTFHAVNKT